MSVVTPFPEPVYGGMGFYALPAEVGELSEEDAEDSDAVLYRVSNCPADIRVARVVGVRR